VKISELEALLATYKRDGDVEVFVMRTTNISGGSWWPKSAYVRQWEAAMPVTAHNFYLAGTEDRAPKGSLIIDPSLQPRRETR
jgi:hypothetical protein